MFSKPQGALHGGTLGFPGGLGEDLWEPRRVLGVPGGVLGGLWSPCG